MDTFLYVGIESGQHDDIQWTCSSALDSRVVNMLRFDQCTYCLGFGSAQHAEILWIRSFISGFASGQHFEIQVIWASMLDSRLVNLLIFYPCFLLPWIREWSTRRVSMNTLYYSGFESGQHVEALLIYSSMLDSRAADMLRFYPCVLLHWIRAWPTCWHANEYVLFFLELRVVNMLIFN